MVFPVFIWVGNTISFSITLDCEFPLTYMEPATFLGTLGVPPSASFSSPVATRGSLEVIGFDDNVEGPGSGV